MNISTRKLIMKNLPDLCDYLLNSERIALWIESSKFLAFRKWINYYVEEEFRCFIYNKKLVAISQYEYGNKLPHQMQCSDLIIKAIKNFVDQVNIPYINVVMDVAFHISNFDVYFIEFNAFGLYSDTDAGLYDWCHDSDILHSDGRHIDIRLFDMKFIEQKFQV